ncbi:MAG: L-threonylcarbamoyladenylate synthase [Patescibacteria group bacterium]
MTTKEIIKIIKRGGVGVLATDTVYGLVAAASMPAAVERVYQLKGRAPDKPCIILIGELSDLKKFAVRPDKTTFKLLKKLWPDKVSVILPLADQNEKLDYLHRGTATLAFRLPANVSLRNLIKKTGPLIAPSANPEGGKPARTMVAAKKYFGGQIDFYFSNNKRLAGTSSTLVAIQAGKIIIVRPGAVKLPT